MKILISSSEKTLMKKIRQLLINAILGGYLFCMCPAQTCAQMLIRYDEPTSELYLYRQLDGKLQYLDSLPCLGMFKNSFHLDSNHLFSSVHFYPISGSTGIQINTYFIDGKLKLKPESIFIIEIDDFPMLKKNGLGLKLDSKWDLFTI